MYEKPRVNVKVERGSTFTFTRGFGVVIVLHVCSHVGSFYLPVVFFFFSFLCFNGFHYFTLVFFDRFHRMSFSVTGVHISCYLNFICLSLRWAGGGARGWVVDTASHGGGSIWQGLGCWPTAGLFWAPDLDLRGVLLIEHMKCAFHQHHTSPLSGEHFNPHLSSVG